MERKDKDIRILVDFINVYCRENHKEAEKNYVPELQVNLCSDCKELALYGVKRRKLCTKDPKPSCKNCNTPCYGSFYKEEIKKIMRFSGVYFIKRGRLDYLYHYLR